MQQEINPIIAYYLGQCHSKGLVASDQGLKSFIQQILSGLRKADGRMHWEN